MLVLAAAFGIAGLMAYRSCGITEFTPKLYSDVQQAYIIGAVICIVSVFFSRKPVKFFGYLALLYAFVRAIAVQATYVTNVLVSIDGNSFSTIFIVMAAASLLSVAAALTATILTAKGNEV